MGVFWVVCWFEKVLAIVVRKLGLRLCWSTSSCRLGRLMSVFKGKKVEIEVFSLCVGSISFGVGWGWRTAASPEAFVMPANDVVFAAMCKASSELPWNQFSSYDWGELRKARRVKIGELKSLYRGVRQGGVCGSDGSCPSDLFSLGSMSHSTATTNVSARYSWR